jgi:glycosyltransferase WbpL
MSAEMTWGLALGMMAFVSTVAGTLAFRALALRKGIVANPNYRSLHQRPMPRGGGVVFSIAFLAVVTVLWRTGFIDAGSMQAIGLGGVVATLFGFADDVIHVNPATKLLAQGGLAAWALFCFDGKPLFDLSWTPTTVELAISWLALVWLMNVYNFMDGVDGMAASGAVFICSAAAIVLLLADGDRSLVLLLGLLALCCLGFLLFNWPPASIFMGDSGSLFLGYCFGALITRTITEGQISLWTWLVIFGYFAGDTTTTTVTRIWLIKNWYGAHRSHAYQNLARIWGNHRKVTIGVFLYHLIWLLPLAVLSEVAPATGPLAAALALGPVVLWTLRYGPRLSSA